MAAGKKARPKGGRAEGQVRDILTEVFYPNGEGKVLKTPGSGTWGGIPAMTGDLVFVKDEMLDPDILIFIEIKHWERRRFAPFKMLAGSLGILEEWYATAREKTAGSKRVIAPVVIWRTDYEPWFVLMDYQAWECFSSLETEFPEEYATLEVCTSSPGGKGYFMMPLKVWAKWMQR